MALQIRAVRLQAPATNTTQDFTISGFGTPQACIVWSMVAGDGTDVDGISINIGMSDFTFSGCHTTRADHNVVEASSTSRNWADASSVIQQFDEASNTIARIATVATTTDGVTLTWTGPDTGIRPWVVVILINGTNGIVAGGVTPNDTDTLSVDETALGITPKVIFGAMSRRNFGDGQLGVKNITFGFAYDNGASIDQYTTFTNRPDSDTSGRFRCETDRISLYGNNVASSGVAGEYEVTDMASGQFTLKTYAPSGGGANADLLYLAIDMDENAAVIDSAVPTTDVAWTPLTGGAFTPQAAIMMPSHTVTQDAMDQDATGGYWGLYVATESEEFGFSVCDEDDAATSNSSARSDTQLDIQDHTAGVPDFSASSPTFSYGQIEYSSANTGEATAAYKVVGIAFEAASTTVAPLAFNHLMKMKKRT